MKTLNQQTTNEIVTDLLKNLDRIVYNDYSAVGKYDLMNRIHQQIDEIVKRTDGKTDSQYEYLITTIENAHYEEVEELQKKNLCLESEIEFKDNYILDINAQILDLRAENLELHEKVDYFKNQCKLRTIEALNAQFGEETRFYN